MIPARILGTGSLLPGRAVTTAEVARAAMPHREPGWLEARTGIHTRHWAPPGTRMAEVAADVLRLALDAANMPARDLRRLIFVSSVGGDMIAPATANAVAGALGLGGTCDGFDVNNACMGFLTAFDIAARSVATGLSPVGIAVVELVSTMITPEDPRPYAVFGDAAAAVVLGPARPGEGVLGVSLGNDGSKGGTVTVDHPRFTGSMGTIRFGIPSHEMGHLAIDLVTRSARAALAESGHDISNVEWFLPHQPNGPMLEAIVKALGVDPARTVPVVQEIGSTAAASIPVSLDRLMRTRSVRPGDRILMAGVGTGLSYGAMLYQVAR